MVRTLITIPEEDKQWLKNYSRSHHVSMAQIIRMAINEFKKRKKNDKNDFHKALEATFGMWKDKNIDSVEYVRQLRSEWDRDGDKLK